MSATRLAGLYAVLAAAASVVFAPLLALSYFATGEGAEELEIGTVSAWADPARDLAGELLTWTSPDRVYATYVQVFALLFSAVFLCARTVRARRSMRGGRLERWGWPIALAGYGLVAGGLAAAFLVLFGGDSAADALNLVFLALMVPGMLVSVVGSTVLGIALLRDGSAATSCTSCSPTTGQARPHALPARRIEVPSSPAGLRSLLAPCFTQSSAMLFLDHSERAGGCSSRASGSPVPIRWKLYETSGSVRKQSSRRGTFRRPRRVIERSPLVRPASQARRR